MVIKIQLRVKVYQFVYSVTLKSLSVLNKKVQVSVLRKSHLQAMMFKISHSGYRIRFVRQKTLNGIVQIHLIVDSCLLS